MPRILIVAYISLILTINLSAQVYHHATGKVIPINQPNQIVWKTGTYNNYPADFGTLVVKENRNNKASRLINIPIIRIKTLNLDSTKSPIFLLNGGPGESNFQPQLFFDKLLDNRDIVLVGYRGVDGSVKLDCPCMKNALLGDSITPDNSSLLFKIAFDSCLIKWENNQIDINGYSMDEVVEDIETTRLIIGYKKINFLSFSYGTMLSQLYSSKYSANVDKMLLIGTRPLNNFIFKGSDYNKQIFNLYKQYSLSNNIKYNNSLDIVLFDIDNMLNFIIDNNKELNPYRFMFFGFSKLYTMEENAKIFEAYTNAVNNNPDNLIKLYNDFYNVFPGDITIGDIILKKQGRVSFENTNNENTVGDKITNVINSWYNPQIDILTRTESYNVSQPDSTEVLFIFGELDVASPPLLFKDENLGFINSSKVIIPNSGHLDLFYSKREIVEKYCTTFF